MPMRCLRLFAGRTLLSTAIAAFLLPVGAQNAQGSKRPALPGRDLTIELRQIEDGRDDGAVRVGTRPEAALLAPQKIQVRNGERGSLRFQQSVPLQWVQSASSQSHSVSQGGTTLSGTGGGLSQSVQWFDVVQSLGVLPRWPGGNKDATLELEIQQADMAVRSNADMPRQTRHHFTTTVTVPLGQWVTVAASDNPPPRQGSYSSESGTDTRRLLQLRVLAP
jgi:hypothetical protein